MATPSEIGAARGLILGFIQGQECPVHFAIKRFNQLYAAGALPPQLQCKVKLAWQKPRGFILTKSTYGKWTRAKTRRGHSMPLTRQRDISIKPWHSLAWLLKERNPKRKSTDILKQLNQKHAGVSIHQLRRFFAFMRTEEAKA